MKTLNLNKQAQKLEKILKKRKMPIQYVTTENGFVKAVRQDGDVCYCTPNLEYSTFWRKSITTENGFVKVTSHKEEVCYYTLDLKRHTSWTKHLSIENGLVKEVGEDRVPKYYTFGLTKVLHHF